MILEKKLCNVEMQIDDLIASENENNKRKVEIKKYYDNFEMKKKEIEIKTKKWEKRAKRKKAEV